MPSVASVSIRCKTGAPPREGCVVKGEKGMQQMSTPPPPLPPRAPSRRSRNARVCGHTTTAMHKLSTPPLPPFFNRPSPTAFPRIVMKLATAQDLLILRCSMGRSAGVRETRTSPTAGIYWWTFW